jgi:pyrroloquinoline quinone biosynthesis protein B
MHVRVLGSAAGGGFPQWNCNCTNCKSVRLGSRPSRPRTQASLAVSADGHGWTVLNASPDIRAQIDAFPALQPQEGLRHTPIRTVVLTNADIDHVVGLLTLREFQPLMVYSTPAVREWVFEQNILFRALKRHEGQLTWKPLETSGTHVLEGVGGKSTGLQYEAYAVPSKAPGWLPEQPTEGVPTVGMRVIDTRNGASVAYVPGVKSVPKPLLEFFGRSKAMFVDGTFFTDDELASMGYADKTSLALGHIPMSGAQGSLATFASLTHVRRVFTHINNTNPVLLEDSAENAAVKAAGFELAYDGMELQL